LNVVEAEVSNLEGQRTLETGEALQMARTHIEVRTAEPLSIDRVPYS
jgi:hypothetical protein